MIKSASMVTPATMRAQPEIRLTPSSDNSFSEAMTVKNPCNNETFGIPSSEQFLLQLLKAVRQELNNSGIIVTDIDHKEWHEVYFFSRQEEIERVNIWYNSKGKVSQVNAPSLSALSSEVVQLISPLKTGGVLVNPVGSNSLIFSQEFQLAFHDRLMPLITNAEITLMSAEELQWALRYSFSKNGAIAVIDINFNGKQQFTKVQALRNKCAGADFVLEVEKILTEGLSA